MTPGNGMPADMQNRGGSIQQMQELTLNILYMLLSMFTYPIELALRPWYGTLCYDPLVSAGGCLWMLLMPLIAGIPEMVRSMIPFGSAHSYGPTALMGPGGMAEIFFLGQLIQSLRLWQRMVHPEREPHSEFVGPSPLPFSLLPKGKSYHFVRIVYEPLFLIIASIVLSDFQILTLGASRYVFFTGILLSVKNSIEWWKSWIFIRRLLDAKFAAPIVAAMAEGKATDEQLASIHMATFPKNLPPEVRTAAIAHMTAALSPETARLVSPVEPPAKPPARPSVAFVQPLVGLLLCAALSLLPMRAQNPAPPPAPANAYVANGADNTVSVVSLANDKVIATIPVGLNPVSEAITPDGTRVYVANHGNGSGYGSGGRSDVSVIDTNTNKVIATINLKNPGGSAMAAIVSRDGLTLYVSNFSGDATVPAGKVISVISTATNEVTGAIQYPEGMVPGTMALSPDGKEIYAATYGGYNILVISTETQKVTAIISLRLDVLVNNTGVSDSPEAIAFSNDGKKAYIGCTYGETFAEIDTVTHKVTFPATFRPRLSLSGLAMTPSSILYAIAGENGLAYAVDTANDTILKSGGISGDGRMLFVGGKPASIALTKDASRAYVANRASNDVSIIDVKKNQTIGSVPVGRFPTAIAIQPGTALSAPTVTTLSGADPGSQTRMTPVAPGLTTTVPIVQPKTTVAPSAVPTIVVKPPEPPATPIKLKGPLGTEIDIPLPHWHRKPKTNQ